MTEAEIKFCYDAIDAKLAEPAFQDEHCVDNFRAARMWISSQRRRFRRDRENGCCGSYDFVVKRWSFAKMRFDIYLLGFNYGH